MRQNIVIHKEWSIIRVVVFIGIVVGLGVGLFAFQTYRDARSRASMSKATPVSFPLESSLIPSPKTDLIPPYIRLVTTKRQYGFQEMAPVEIYMETGDQEVMEADVALSFDPDLLEISQEYIRVTDVFKVLDVETVEEGTVDFSLFVNPTVGHKPVVAEKEIKIATLNFKIKALEKNEVEIGVSFEKGQMKGTGLIPYTKERGEIKNILESVEGVVFSVGS